VAELPFVDEHSVDVDAPAAVAWDAAVANARGAFGSGAGGLFARAVGCEETEIAGTPGEEGSTIVGFRIETSRPPQELGMAGRHRFSEYRLTFLIEPLDGGRSRVRALTHARFPGFHGDVYRTLVVRSRIHVLVTRHLLNGIAERAKRAAEHSAPPTTAGR
jgi:hypothetical protein